MVNGFDRDRTGTGGGDSSSLVFFGDGGGVVVPAGVWTSSSASSADRLVGLVGVVADIFFLRRDES